MLSAGGGAAVIAADALMKHHLELPQLSQGTIEKLDSLLPPRWSRGNPVETGGDPFSYSCLWALIEDENVDAALVIGGGGVTGSYAKWVSLPASASGQIDQWLEDAEVSELGDVDKSVELMKKYQKPIIFANMG